MIRISHLPHVVLMSAVLAGAVGCGGVSDRPAVFPVKGKVTLNGAPVEGAQVSFFAEGSPRAASGTTDAEGNYQLTTFDTNDGAIAGDHKVAIAKNKGKSTGEAIDMGNLEDPGAGYGDAMDAAASGEYGDMVESMIPTEYGSADTSGLTRTVTESDTENVFNFDL